MIALAFKLPAEDSPLSGSLRVLDVDITLERVDDVAAALRELVGRLPDHPGILPLTDIHVAAGRLVVVTPPAEGDALDSALAMYGPAAVDDALPRVRQIAGALDVAAQAGLCHGALHPGDILVSADDTRVAGLGVAAALARAGIEVPRAPRYTAPEVLAGRTGSPAGDEFSLAVIAHEWMFGGAAPPADGFLAVPAMAGFDVDAMQQAIDTATAADPDARFGSCLAFAAALERATALERGAGLAQAPLIVDPDELPLRIEDREIERERESAEERRAPIAASLFSAAPPPARRQFGAVALVGALLVGIALGAAGMSLLGHPALDGEGTLQDVGAAPVVPAADAPAGPTEVIDPPVTPPRDDMAMSPPPPVTTPVAPADNDAAPAAPADAGLLIHSTPPGAVVTVDGIARGATPVAVRGLEFGTRRVGLSSPGYQAAERLVTLTAARPSRTLDVDLLPIARAAAPPPPARSAGTAASASLVVDSRPAGASVTIDGRPSGRTPMTLTGLAPGRRTVRIDHPGYRAVTTTVDVKAGERARVAARLEGGPDDE